MLNVAVCDDSSYMREITKKYLMQYSFQKNVDIHIFEYEKHITIMKMIFYMNIVGSIMVFYMWKVMGKIVSYIFLTAKRMLYAVKSFRILRKNFQKILFLDVISLILLI